MLKKAFFGGLLAALAFMSTFARADFPVQYQVNVTPQQVTLTVENIWAAPIFCRGEFFAQTYSRPYGIWLSFQIGPISAGQWGYAYMTPPFVQYGDYFIAVPQVNAGCNYIYE